MGRRERERRRQQPHERFVQVELPEPVLEPYEDDPVDWPEPDNSEEAALHLQEMRREAGNLARKLAQLEARRVVVARSLHDDHGVSWDRTAVLLGGTVNGETLRRWCRG